MIIGDEHIAVISAEGRLPRELKREPLLIVPAAHERLKLAGAKTAGLARGQISGPLSRLDKVVRDALLLGDTQLFTVIDQSTLQDTADKIAAEAGAAGVRLNRLASEYAAAAAVYRAAIWFGHDRNVPRAIRDRLVPTAVRWRLLSELGHTTQPAE